LNVDLIEASKKTTFLFTSSEFFATLQNKSKPFQAIFILDNEKNKSDYQQRFSTSEQLIFQLANELFRYYKTEAKEDLQSGNSFESEIKETIANKIYHELKKAYQSVPATTTTITSSVDTTVTLICLTSESHRTEMEQLKKILDGIVSICEPPISAKDKSFGTVFVIQDTNYEDEIVTNLRESLNIKTIYYYGDISSKHKTALNSYNDLCFELISDLATHYKKLGSACNLINDAKTAKNMFDKSAQLYKTLSKF